MYKKTIVGILAMILFDAMCFSIVSAEIIPIKKVSSVLRESVVPVKRTETVIIDLKGEGFRKSQSNRDIKIRKIAENKKINEKKENERVSLGPEIGVGLLTGQTEVVIRVISPLRLEINDKIHSIYKSGSNLRVSRNGNGIQINGANFKESICLNPGNMDPSFTLKNNTYRGKIKICPSTVQGKVNIINVVPMEIYLQGVVPCEIIPTWSKDSIKAQAVAARTYALYHKNGYQKAGYDVTDDTRSQVYRGYSAESDATNRAIRDTVGEIITYGGKPIDALFHSNGGGYTENSEDVWGTYIPYLRAVREEKSEVVNRNWSKKISLSEFTSQLSDAGYNVGRIKEITLSRLSIGNGKAKDRGISGRVKYLDITGIKDKKRITGTQLQGLFDLQSTLFDISVQGEKIIFTGYGFGHGLGLSQWGAESMAKKYGDGKDYYIKILTHYFTGTKIEKIY